MEITATVNIPVLGGGGSFTYDDCVRYLMAGCGLAGLCSSVYSRGVHVLKRCVDGLNDYMDRKGYQNIEDFQGCGWCVGHCKPNAIKCIHTETGKVVWDGYGTIADWVTI